MAECLSSILTSMGVRSNSTSYTPMDRVIMFTIYNLLTRAESPATCGSRICPDFLTSNSR
ncbi:hypothetical protein Lepto1548_08465 [Leptospira interrogans serovar Bataviae]|nr:hypothetical protein Lepto1548_08465 [Leptospira interrogans serovar Bataviae]